MAFVAFLLRRGVQGSQISSSHHASCVSEYIFNGCAAPNKSPSSTLHVNPTMKNHPTSEEGFGGDADHSLEYEKKQCVIPSPGRPAQSLVGGQAKRLRKFALTHKLPPARQGVERHGFLVGAPFRQVHKNKFEVHGVPRGSFIYPSSSFLLDICRYR